MQNREYRRLCTKCGVRHYKPTGRKCTMSSPDIHLTPISSRRLSSATSCMQATMTTASIVTSLCTSAITTVTSSHMSSPRHLAGTPQGPMSSPHVVGPYPSSSAAVATSSSISVLPSTSAAAGPGIHAAAGGGVLPMWWVIHMCRGFDPLFSLWQDRARSFWGIFSHPPTPKRSFGVLKLPILTEFDLLGPKFHFSLDLFGSNFQRPAAHPHHFSDRVPPPPPPGRRSRLWLGQHRAPSSPHPPPAPSSTGSGRNNSSRHGVHHVGYQWPSDRPREDWCPTPRAHPRSISWCPSTPGPATPCADVRQ